MSKQLSFTDPDNLRGAVRRSYQRVLRSFAFQDHDNIEAEVDHCRAMIAAFDAHCPADSEKTAIVSLNPELILIQAKVVVARDLADGYVADAVFHAERALTELLNHYCTNATIMDFEASQEVASLQKLCQLIGRYADGTVSASDTDGDPDGRLRLLQVQITRDLREDSRAYLGRALTVAVDEERYEDAALFRDQLDRHCG